MYSSRCCKQPRISDAATPESTGRLATPVLGFALTAPGTGEDVRPRLEDETKHPRPTEFLS